MAAEGTSIPVNAWWCRGMERSLGEKRAEDVVQTRRSGAVFVLPIRAGPNPTPNASWITTAGLASAAEQRWGSSQVATPEGILSPKEVLQRASQIVRPTSPARRRLKMVPEVAKTAAKDVLLLIRAWRFRRAISQSSLIDGGFEFVWQRHVPFHNAGAALARSAGCPLVLSVHALMVQEARQWGMGRPGWGRLMEWFGERRLLRRADLVACVSDEVAVLVRRQGVPEDRVIVTPNGVDLDRFQPREPDFSTQRTLGLDESQFVLGWVGSFRTFHGLERLFDAMEDLQGRGRQVTLLLVGAGPGLQRAEEEVKRRNLRNVSFAGSFPYNQMPSVLSVMQAAVVMGSADKPFHYSPVKVREYMAAGLPVIATRLGELERILTDGKDALLVDPASTAELTRAIERLMDDPELRTRLGGRARQRISQDGSWAAVLSSLVGRVSARDSS